MCVGLFSGCGSKNRTGEEHIQRITEKLKTRYFKADGTPAKEGYFPVVDTNGQWIGYYDDNRRWVGEYLVIESFVVETLLSFDGISECFLIAFEPAAIGVMPGIILNKEYRIFQMNLRTNNPFEDHSIEKGNRYYSFQTGYAAMVDELLTNLDNNDVYEKDEIENKMQYMRSFKGRRFIRNYSARL
jgi:hypothetical protein